MPASGASARTTASGADSSSAWTTASGAGRGLSLQSPPGARVGPKPPHRRLWEHWLSPVALCLAPSSTRSPPCPAPSSTWRHLRTDNRERRRQLLRMDDHERRRPGSLSVVAIGCEGGTRPSAPTPVGALAGPCYSVSGTIFNLIPSVSDAILNLAGFYTDSFYKDFYTDTFYKRSEPGLVLNLAWWPKSLWITIGAFSKSVIPDIFEMEDKMDFPVLEGEAPLDKVQ